MSAVVDQKSYLQKYLGGPSKEKKKKKKKAIKGKGFKIIDDDIDLTKLRALEGDELDILDEGEDAPQIAGIIDERPEDVRKLEQFKTTSKWRVVNQDDGFNSKLQIEEIQKDVKEVEKENEIVFGKMYSDSEDEKQKNDSDVSPPRKVLSKKDDSDASPPRKQDLSPRRKERDQLPKRKETRYDSDASPPRKAESKRERARKPSRWGYFEPETNVSPKQSNSRSNKSPSSDPSPPRKKKNYDSDESPPRRKKIDNSDASPPRNRKSSPQKSKNRGRSSSLDLSPPRKTGKRKSPEQYNKAKDTFRKNRDQSDKSRDLSDRNRNLSDRNRDLSDRNRDLSDRNRDLSDRNRDLTDRNKDLSDRNRVMSDKNMSGKDRNRRQDSDSDVSPPRKGRDRSDTDKKLKDKRKKSPSPRKRRNNDDSDLSPPRKEINESSRHKNRRKDDSDSDMSPPRKNKNLTDRDRNMSERDRYTSNRDRNTSDRDRNKRRNSDSPPPSNKKMAKTLEGKVAGLQNAKQLREENEDFRKKEEEVFRRLGDEVSGRNAKAVSRKSKRDTSEDRQKQKEKAERQKELDAKYKIWSKGVKQVEDQQARVQDFIHEASKPVARHRDDKDLEHSLKQVERAGDPMLQYMREKKRERGELPPERPSYKGNFPPNRFNIRPGYRWDGVDRSNGYEGKFFQQQNKRKAQEEEAYKWSTEDL